jgi:hypothetical protein
VRRQTHFETQKIHAQATHLAYTGPQLLPAGGSSSLLRSQLLLQVLNFIQQQSNVPAHEGDVVIVLLLQLLLQICDAAGLLRKLQLLGLARVAAALQLQLNLQQGDVQ